MLCETIDNQTNQDWEHLIAVDIDLGGSTVFDLIGAQGLTADQQKKINILKALKRDPRRQIFCCSRPHKDGGNTCRRELSAIARGDYVHYIDDDNYYADERVLETLEGITAPLASFALLYKGVPQRSEPVESTNVIVRQGLHRFPDSSERDADQIFVRDLLRDYPDYQMITDRPLVVVPYDNTEMYH